MKRVLIGNIFFPEGKGGAESVMLKRAQLFVEAGDTVTILIPGDSSGIAQYAKDIDVIRFRPLHVLVYKNAGLYSFQMRFLWHVVDVLNIGTYFQVRAILKALDPDAVECHNLQGVGYLIPSLLRALQKPYSLYLHDVQLSIPSGILLYGHEHDFINNGILQKTYEWLTRSLIGSPDTVISPSSWLMAFYTDRAFFQNSKKEIITKTDSFSITDIQHKLVSLTEKIAAKKNISCIYIGKLEEYKGFKWLLDVWKELPQSFQLSVFGSGTLETLLKNEGSRNNQIQYYGYQKGDGLMKHLKKSDVLIVPSLCYENSPETIVDALTYGIPVIASNIGGIPELVINGKTGYLFKPGSIRSFYTALGKQNYAK